MAANFQAVFIWPGLFTTTGANIEFLGNVTIDGVLKLADGAAGTPSVTFASDPDTGLYSYGANQLGLTAGGTLSLYVANGEVWLPSNSTFLAFGAGEDVRLFRDAANILALRNSTNAQAFRTYGYSNGSRAAYGAIQTASAALTLSGATTVTGNIVPAGCFVIGVATTTTTAITGASGYQVGDGSDADRYGDITGIAVGTHSDNTTATANPTGYNAAASAITLTAKTSNFTGGVVQVVVAYVTTGAS